MRDQFRYLQLATRPDQLGKVKFSHSAPHCSNKPAALKHDSTTFISDKSLTFNKLRDIMLSDDTDYNKQFKIETLLRDLFVVEGVAPNNKIEIDQLLKSGDVSSKGLGIKFLIKQLSLIDKDLKDYINMKKFIKNKPFISYIKSLDPSLILSIILSQLIPFIIRHREVDSQNVTTLFLKIGDKLYRELFFDS
jgi:hypothetical protein